MREGEKQPTLIIFRGVAFGRQDREWERAGEKYNSSANIAILLASIPLT